MLYKGIELTCTQAELDVFVSKITVESEIRPFSQPFNGVEMVNNTGNEAAKYYFCK
ncbi:hypothetical protein [uncultured Brevibacillus sp.]|uniref:hypothetical protein n=1 Tax=uncultured Brevibacillus sp. TaxID=169970 RepID=UPI0025942DE1|nr:hypothetical protein [uncultured Brevibacillus sp.]